MKRMLVTVAMALLVVGVSELTSSATTITAGAYIGSAGTGTGESLVGTRLRSFLPSGKNDPEHYLGIPDLGTAGNRVWQNVDWMKDPNNPLTSFDFTFQYDQANDRLVSTIFGGTITGGTIRYDDWSTQLASRGKTKGAADLNALQISITLKDSQSTTPKNNVYLTDMVLDGVALGSFDGVYPSTADWLVTGSDMNLTDGFTLTGKLWLEGPFSNSPDNSRVDLAAGWDSRGEEPSSVPDGGFTLTLLGGALLGLAVLRRKVG